MIKNYILISWRNIRKSRVFTAINIIGLAIGMASCILILFFVTDELRYDTHYPDADQIYRIALERSYPDRTSSYAAVPMPVAPALETNYPEVEDATRIATAFPMSVRYEDRSFKEDNILVTHSFNMFYMLSNKFLKISLIGVLLSIIFSNWLMN